MPSRTGYTFGGYYTGTNGSGTQYYNADGTSTRKWDQTSNNATLYAKWTAIPATSPTITKQPENLPLIYGYDADNKLSVMVTAAADGTYDLGYQWFSCEDTVKTNPQKIDLATEASYAIPTGKSAETTEYYYCVVTATRKDNGQTATASSAVATLTISKKEVTVTATPQSVELNGSITPFASDPDMATLSYAESGHSLGGVTLIASSTAGVTTSGTVMPSDATIMNGIVDVTANYDIHYVDGTLTVMQTQPVEKDPPTAAAVTYGDRLSTIAIAGSMKDKYTGSEVAGTFAWQTPDVMPAVSDSNKTEYAWTFTPTDDVNYAPVTGVATLTVSPAPAPDPSSLTDAQKPTPTAPTADGTPKELVIPPQELPTGYTGVQYSIDGGTNWTEPNVVPTAIVPDTYEVQVRYVPDGNHTAFDGTSVKVEIQPNYYVVEAESTSAWMKGSRDDAVIKVRLRGLSGKDDNSFQHFKSVAIDGAGLSEDSSALIQKDYKAEEGSTVITLHKKMLNRLSAGKHTVTITFDNGEVEAPLTILVPPGGYSPATGDGARIGFWAALMVLAGLGFAGADYARRRLRRPRYVGKH